MAINKNHKGGETSDRNFSSYLFILFDIQCNDLIVQWLIGIDFFGNLIIIFGEWNTMRASGGVEFSKDNFVFIDKGGKVSIS